MQYPLISDRVVSPSAQNKPHPASYDSNQEFSLAHRLELIRLVEKEDRELTGYVFDDACLRVSE
jgi:hypothetical protein